MDEQQFVCLDCQFRKEIPELNTWICNITKKTSKVGLFSEGIYNCKYYNLKKTKLKFYICIAKNIKFSLKFKKITINPRVKMYHFLWFNFGYHNTKQGYYIPKKYWITKKEEPSIS